jgi:hypothetical protein
LDTLGGTRKKTAQTEGPKISIVFTNTSDLDAVKHVKPSSKEIINFDWVDPKAYSFFNE